MSLFEESTECEFDDDIYEESGDDDIHEESGGLLAWTQIFDTFGAWLDVRDTTPDVCRVAELAACGAFESCMRSMTTSLTMIVLLTITLH